MLFPDVQHVDAIRRALWADRTPGRAAVMVGSGMSRNAVPLRPGRPTMPTWWELTSALVDRLYPDGSGHDRRRRDLLAQAGATSAALRLADEFVAAFGRPALDDLLLAMIPDHDFAPGPLHDLLLDLPWADVLTTNYDTLLERTAWVSSRARYAVVRTPDELPSAAHPRIVKLHGSFPSNRPFVLTEEDFRTYPRRFAPFVNLAQQVALENVLCLVGFSGDDPNFLAWTGWVRDHLAGYAPRVYLCGLLDLTTAQRTLLQARGVVPVDLTPVFPADPERDPTARHRDALRWFLLSLREGRPYDPLEWPTPPPAVVPEPGLPPLLRPTLPLPRAEPYSPGQR